jgi:hypothetical protein
MTLGNVREQGQRIFRAIYWSPTRNRYYSAIGN